MKVLRIETFALLLCGGLCSCAAAVPPSELVEARQAYSRAQSGAAAKYAPAELDNARQSLERAERAFEDDAKGDRTKTDAYVALRRAEIAQTEGAARESKEKHKELKKQFEKLERERLNMTSEELAKARATLEEERKNLHATQEELDKERAARKSAENKLSAAVASLNELAQVKEESRGVVITLSGSVLFATGKHELLSIAKDKLNEVAQVLKDQGFRKVIVEGHTDSQGSDTKNQELSLARAEAVRTHLVSQGLPAAQIEARGLGESRPVATNATPEGRANNRRVELVVEPE